MELFHAPAVNFSGKENKLTIASGPVILDHEGRFLLHTSETTGKYQFVGGRLSLDETLVEAMMRHTLEATNLQVRLLSDKPYIVQDAIERDGYHESLILVHFHAQAVDESEGNGQYEWFSLDEVVRLDREGQVSSPNILLACKYFAN